MNEKIKEYKYDITRITISAIALILSFINIKIYSIDLSWIAILLCAIPIIYNSILALIYEHDIKADILISIAIIASIFTGEIFAAGEIAVIMEIGGLLEEITVSTTQLRIEKLIELQPTTATIINKNNEEKINALNLKENNIIKIRPGEIVPADGIIIKGISTIDQSIITGESIPVDKTINDEVYAGIINNQGTLIVKVTKDGKENSLQKLIKMIEDINTDDSKIVRQADKWANYIVVMSLTIAILTYIFTGRITNAVTVLVVFCPCALILATPTAIVAAIGNLSKYGILLKNAEKLESIHTIEHIIFDKTGTITTGIPKVTEEVTLLNDTEEFLKITASLESYSEHPLAKTIVNHYHEKYPDKELYEVDDFNMEISMGISGNINNKPCIVGNEKLFKKHNIKIPIIKDIDKNQILSSTITYTYYDNQFLGILLIQDTPRENVKYTMNNLKSNGYDPILLTGDNENVAKYIASPVGINTVESNCIPETKLNYVEKIQDNGEQVLMVGDGVNDVLAMSKSDVGIAMGDVGSDITISSAGAVFINDEIKFLPYLLHISKKTLKTINRGISFAMTLNIIAVIFGIIGILTPITGALVHNVGSVIVIIFAALIFKEKPDKFLSNNLERI
ncbi:cation-translocating P-type ATPase [Methanosphaera sp. Vir-13MRS]|uniref:heavy metal translocating P-type ATPase n=1 Tax=Candidatus Methanosphaera massiliense TaxID=3017187 RepID=UPI00237FFB4C|nr:cation-translocating P-type ATPase [Candidatus Methanosphaera massiliense]MDE4078494.1 cation-translocating P-type ATPase [Candidatus Methanosphaera massiliense]